MTAIPFYLPKLRLQPRLLLWTIGLALTGALLYLFLYGYGTPLTALMLFAVFLGILIYDKVIAILVTLAYLFFLGDIRRIRDVAFPHPNLDPLLLVGPAIVILVGVPLILKARATDPLAKAMLYLTLLMAFQVFNPLQGGIGIGLGGAFFYLVPILWFWIGREYGSVAVLEKALYNVVLPIALLASLMGLYQNFVGFLPYQQVWIDANKSTFVILHMGNGTRSFGFSVAPSEYATLVEIGAAASVGAFLAGRRLWIFAFPVLLTAMILSSGRTVMVKLAFALALVWAIRKSKSLGIGATIRLLIFLSVGLATISFVAGRYINSVGDSSSNTANSAALQHEAAGLANPLDAQKSTAGAHSQMVLGGIAEGLKNPIGRGLGSTTAAAGKLGSSDEAMDTEIDISDMFICIGLPGGVLYLYIVFLTFRDSIAFIRTAPKAVSLLVLAILAGGIGTWLIVSQYSTAALYMFLIGCVANSQSQSRMAGRATTRLETDIRAQGVPLRRT
jgi:hypothetical protein